MKETRWICNICN